MLGQITAATECFHQMNSELSEEVKLRAEREKWVVGECSCIPCWYSRLSVYFLLEFRQRLFTKLEHLGDTAMNAQRLDEAISAYSSALSLEPAASSRLLVKRSKAYVATSLWEKALNDANEVRSFFLLWSDLVDARSLGDHARSIISMGPREEARSFTRGRTL